MAAVSWRYPQDEFVALRRQNAEAERRANVTAAGGLDVSSLRFPLPDQRRFAALAAATGL
jgi:type IV secretion system protein TrbG